MSDLTRRDFLSVAGATAVSACASPRGSGRPSSPDYDVVIVGGGSAGCVLAARLSEDANRRVLLLEAGEFATDPRVDDPKQWIRLLGGDLVYPDLTVNQDSLGGKQLYAGHGKTIGGSSAINAMIHHRPVAQDIDGWGLPGWAWQDIEPMLRYSEHYLGAPTPSRGTQGPIQVMPLPDPPPLAETVMRAADRLGVGTSLDINGAQQTGAAINQLAFGDNKRQHTGLAYLAPASARQNLTIRTGAKVTSLLLNGGRCEGVRYQYQGQVRNVSAGRVILSAGTLRTPQILMLSGLGPADHLQASGIAVFQNVAEVGANLHDHMLVSGNNYSTPAALQQSRLHGSVAVVYGQTPTGESRDILLNVSTSPNVFPPLAGAKAGFKSSFSFTRPFSRGTVALDESDPTSMPRIDLNFLGDPRDVAGSIAALSLSRQVLSARELQRFNATELNMDYFEDQAGIREFLHAGATPFGHYCGTCRMGIDEQAPVSTELAFRGVAGLDVVDASVIPRVPSSPTNALVVAMAELYAQRFED